MTYTKNISTDGTTFWVTSNQFYKSLFKRKKEKLQKKKKKEKAKILDAIKINIHVITMVAFPLQKLQVKSNANQ